MAKEHGIFSGSKLKYKGIFDLNMIYKKLRLWLMDLGYSDPKEIKYVERVKTEGKMIEFIWEMDKTEEKDYFKIKQEIKFMIVGLQEVEVENDGKKMKMDNAEVELEFSSSVVSNANDDWEEETLMHKLYKKHIIHDKIEFYKIETYKDTTDIMDELKNYFNLYKF